MPSDRSLAGPPLFDVGAASHSIASLIMQTHSWKYADSIVLYISLAKIASALEAQRLLPGGYMWGLLSRRVYSSPKIHMHELVLPRRF
jgi:hypothetical protein